MKLLLLLLFVYIQCPQKKLEALENGLKPIETELNSLEHIRSSLLLDPPSSIEHFHGDPSMKLGEIPSSSLDYRQHTAGLDDTESDIGDQLRHPYFSGDTQTSQNHVWDEVEDETPVIKTNNEFEHKHEDKPEPTATHSNDEHGNHESENIDKPDPTATHSNAEHGNHESENTNKPEPTPTHSNAESEHDKHLTTESKSHSSKKKTNMKIVVPAVVGATIVGTAGVGLGITAVVNTVNNAEGYSTYTDNPYAGTKLNVPYSTYTGNPYAGKQMNVPYSTYTDNPYAGTKLNVPYSTYTGNPYAGNPYNVAAPQLDKQDSIGKSHIMLYTLVFTAIVILLIFAYAFVIIKSKKDSHIDANTVLMESIYGITI